MSLEASITKLTAAIETLIAKLEAHDALPKATAVASVTAAASPAAVDAPTAAAATPATAPVKYDADRVSAKVAINRTAVVDLLSRYGVKKGSQVKAEQLPAFFAELDKIEAAA